MPLVKAWHFTGPTLRDGSPIPPPGRWLTFDGPVVICQSGLHASRKPFDALRYAPGPMLHYVECDGIAEEQADKLVCRRRRIVASMDATEMLRYFARMQALSVVHLWDAPDVVLDYLMTGDEELRAAAWAAAWGDEARGAASRAASWAAALGDASLDAAWAAALGDASWNAAWAAALGDASWNAAGDAFDKLVHECFADFMT